MPKAAATIVRIDWRAILLGLGAGLAAFAGYAGDIELGIGARRFAAEVANTPDSRARGLMRRIDVPENRGMLFVFARPSQICMWMKNTPTPLSVAFIDDTGRIINLADMDALSERIHCSRLPARYALEMRRGWFAARSIQPGEHLDGLETAPRANE